jgi:hypothetical protein
MKELFAIIEAFIAPTVNAFLSDSGPNTRALVLGGFTLVVLLVIVSGVFIGASTAILVAAAGALISVIAVFWASLRTLLGETPLSGADAYVFGAPPKAEEEQKRAVLRALKDIEFERNVGKISEDDYKELVAKYRAEAKRLLQSLDEKAAPGRERAEVLVLKKLRQAGLADASTAAEVADETNPDETNSDEVVADKPESVEPSVDGAVEAVAMIVATKPPVKKKKAKKKAKPAFEPDAAAEVRACSKCGTSNDADARFCKKCGASMAEAGPSEASSQSKSDEEANAS